MSKADKMFKGLGFNKIELNYGINYGYNDFGYVTELTFIKDTKTYEYENLDIGINKDLHLAIHEKFKELGWLDD